MGNKTLTLTTHGQDYKTTVQNLVDEGYQRDKVDGIPTEEEIRTRISKTEISSARRYIPDGRITEVEKSDWLGYSQEVTIFSHKTFHIGSKEFIKHTWSQGSFFRKMAKYVRGTGAPDPFFGDLWIPNPIWQVELYAKPIAESNHFNLVFLVTVQRGPGNP